MDEGSFDFWVNENDKFHLTEMKSSMVVSFTITGFPDFVLVPELLA